MADLSSELRVAYRAFTVNDLGRLGGIPEIITAADDGDAVLQVERLFCAQPMEVWEGARLVARIPMHGGTVGCDAHRQG